MKEIKIPPATKKNKVFSLVESYLTGLGIRIKSRDENRPWGGFFHIDERDLEKFIDCFFSGTPNREIRVSEKLSPKILLVESGKRLSWQYHHRRAEIWRVVGGPVKVMISNSDKETKPIIKNFQDIIILNKGERHRLIGGDGWGVIAEIWQHTDTIPSDEDDIVRVQDDFGR